MANYFEMTRDELAAEKAALEEEYKKFQAMGLKLNMARGKPGPHQMDLAMGLLQMTDYTTDAGTDARNYGDLEGLHEARELFADVMGVKPEEVFVGGNSSLQLMYNLISMGYSFGFPESPCPWSQVEKRKFLCPVPGYDRHFSITEEFGFELISVPMTPDGPDMDVVEKLVAEDDTIKGIWCVPQYSNPDGYTYSDETIDRFAKMKTAAPDFKIFWDEAYIVHHLTDVDKVIHQLQAGVAAHEHFLRLYAKDIRKQHAGLLQAFQLAIVAGIRTGIGGIVIHLQQVHSQIHLVRAGLAAGHVQLETLGLKFFILCSAKCRSGAMGNRKYDKGVCFQWQIILQ